MGGLVMNPEVKKLWLDALRSGEYKQGRYKLRGIGGYCCLGVLCDLHSKTAEGHKWCDAKFLAGGSTYLGDAYGLPTEVRSWAGLLGSTDREVTVARLGEDNDRGSTFAEIADRIEREL
jgi:hypothetical protein